MALIKIKRGEYLTGHINTDFISVYDHYENTGYTRAKMPDGSYVEFTEPTYEEFNKIMHRKKMEVDWTLISLFVFIIIMSIL